jgi:Tfp pilus assembly protein PilF
MFKRGVLLLPLLLPLLVGCSVFKPIFGPSKADKDRQNDYLARGLHYYDAGKYVQAEQQFRKALEIDEDDVDANLGLAWALLYENTVPKLDEAEKQMLLARDLDDEDFRVYYGLGNVDYAKARMCQRQLDFWKTQPPVVQQGADPVRDKTSERDLLLEAATKNYRHALELNRDYPYALSGLGQIAALRGDRDEALQFFYKYLDTVEERRRFYEERKTRVQNPSGLDVVQRGIESEEKKEADVRILVAALLFDKEDFEGALTQLNRVLEIKPDSAREYLNRGQCYAKLGDFRQASIDVETFLKKAGKVSDTTLEDAHRLLEEYRSKTADSEAAKGGK